MTQPDPADGTTPSSTPDPAKLTFVGLSRDRRHLLLMDDHGAELTLDITAELRTAVRGERDRERGEAPRRLETKMTSSIRPREIQDRIRAGESPEVVAEAAATSVEAIMPYVAPVLAEREHVAARAQKASLRRAPGETAPAHTQSRALGDAVAAHLRGIGADPETVAWDAYRRETGRWVLSGAFETAERSGTARFTYDAPGSYVLADNDDARWIVGDVVVAAAAAPVDDLRHARERRLASVSADQLPLGDDALDLVSGDAAPDPLDVPEPRRDEPVRATGEEQPMLPELTEAELTEEPTQAEIEAEQARHRRPVQKKRGRASVPSWDEIMFGGGDQ